MYATREGQTGRIAARLASAIVAHELTVEVLDAAHLPSAFNLDAYSAAIIAASVHGGRHEPEIITFVKHHLAELQRIQTAFLSVSLSEAGAEDPNAPAVSRAKAAADVEKMIAAFVSETGWHPAKIKPVAGALLYTRYNFFLRFVMKRISRKAGATTDTSTDHEYTDWAALDQFVDELFPRGQVAT